MEKYQNCLILLFTTVLSSISVMTLQAEDKALQVLQTDGQIVTINLKEEPKTTYGDGQLIITTTKAKITYPLEKVRRYTYTSIANDISSSQALKTIFSDDGETLTFLGLHPQTIIMVYNVAGQLLQTIKSGNSNKVVVSVSHLPMSVYIIKVNGVSYKISKK